jgi:hypothetical protein
VELRRRRISDTLPKVVEEPTPGEARRYRIDADIRFLQPAGLTGVTIDATHTEMTVVVDSPLRPGQRCVAVVQLATGEELHERAEVVWAKRAPNGWMAGLSFAR